MESAGKSKDGKTKSSNTVRRTLVSQNDFPLFLCQQKSLFCLAAVLISFNVFTWIFTVFRGRIVSKKIVGKETCYDVQVVITYKNNFPILRREYMWVPNTCDCPSLLEKREYILMARRHVNYEKTLNRILLETDSFVRLYKPKEDKMLRDLDQECAKYGYPTHPKLNQ